MIVAVGDAALSVALHQRVFEVHGNCRDIEQGPGKQVYPWAVA